MAQQQTPAPVNPAEAYERYFVPALAAPWAEDLLGRAAPQPGERVLDVACGTGIVARLAAPRVGPTGEVVGVDPNPGMLGVARAAAAGEGVAIDWREGRGEALPVDDADFDLVCCQQGLQFFEDRAAGLREMRRVLASDGRVAVSVGQAIEHHPLHAALDEIIARHLGAPLFARTIFSRGDAHRLGRGGSRRGEQSSAGAYRVENQLEHAVRARQLLTDRQHLRSTQLFLKPVPITCSCRGATPPVDEQGRWRLLGRLFSQHAQTRNHSSLLFA